MSNNRGTRRNPRYSGRVGYKGHKKWVGTYPTADEYNKAAEAARKELREEVDGEKAKKNEVPTVLEFAGATIHENGRITMTWPDGQRAQKETGRRDRTVNRMREALKPFIREFGVRRLDSFTRDEALTWALPKGANTQQAARQLFNHAKDRDLIEQNHFSRLGASKRKRRVDRPDFEIVTDEQYEELLRCARASRADEFGLIIEGAILAVGEAALRPGEVFAFHRDEVDWKNNELPVRWQLDPETSKRTWPKDDEPRPVPMSPRLSAHLQKMPMLGKILFPAVRGGYMNAPNWSRHWHAVRASAGMPGLEFYSLKHRAIQWMVDPVEDGGLGLDPKTAAVIVGHEDGGYLISTVYTKLSEKRARERARRAMAEHEKRRKAEKRQLYVVGGE
jgi:integrase